MPIHKTFGKAPTEKILVRTQQVSGGKVLQTRTAAVYGAEFDEVINAIDGTLAEEFGGDVEEPAPAEAPARIVKIPGKKRRA
jgi:hypothetical protein